MKTAVLVKDLEVSSIGIFGPTKQAVYKLSSPLQTYDYVIVSAAMTTDHGPETYIFGCDHLGNNINFTELRGSFIGDMDHEAALNGAGYKVAHNESI